MVSEFGWRTARSPEAGAGIVVTTDPNANLALGRASVVEGTDVMRAELLQYREGSGFSSGSGYSQEVRNILFLESGEKAARWLLPDHDHVIVENSDITNDSKQKRTIATAVLVKSRAQADERAKGRLLLFDVSGRKIVEVSNGVRTIHVAALSSGELTLLYERDRRLTLATFDPESLAKRREEEIDIPQLR